MVRNLNVLVTLACVCVLVLVRVRVVVVLMRWISGELKFGEQQERGTGALELAVPRSCCSANFTWSEISMC